MTYLNTKAMRQLSPTHRDFLNRQVEMELERKRIWRIVEALPMEEIAPNDKGERVVAFTAASAEELKSICRFPVLRYLAERALDLGTIDRIQLSTEGGAPYNLPIALIFMNPTG